MKRIFALLSVCLLLIGLLAACDVSELPEESSTAATTTTAPNDPTDPTDPTIAPDNSTTAPNGGNVSNRPTTAPPTSVQITSPVIQTTTERVTTTIALQNDKVVDMGGYSFVMTSSWMVPENEATTLFEFQFFERVNEVKKDYNCKFTLSSLYADLATLQPYVQAGRKVADVLETTPYQYYPLASAGYLKPWSEVSDTINTSDARWTPGYTKLGTFRDVVYGIQFMRPPEVRYCVVFNKTFLKSIGENPDALYDAVASKTWDWDMMRNIALKATKDTNGDGVTDTWGIVGEFNYFFTSIFWSNNTKLVTIDANGKAVCTVPSTEAVEALEFCDRLANIDKVYFVDDTLMRTPEGKNSAPYTNYDWAGKFLEGNSAFLFYESWAINQKIRPNAKFDYGMLPIPMGPKADDYVAPAPYGRVFVMTATNKDADKTAIIFNAIARPVDGVAGLNFWEDLQAEYFQENDTKSLDMYKLCLDKSMADPGCAVTDLYFDFTHTGGWGSVMFQVASPAAALGTMSGKFDSIVNALYN